MAQQSAVEFILVKILDGDWESTPWPKRREIIEQAKQMEKEQIMKTARQCHFEGVRQSAKTSEEYIVYAEQYYNETYNK